MDLDLRSRSITRTLRTRRSWPVNEEINAKDFHQAIGQVSELRQSIGAELRSMKTAMEEVHMTHKAMQLEASSVVRDLKNALQTVHAQQNQLSSAMGEENERMSHIQRQQQQLQSEVQYLDHGQHEVVNKVQQQEAVVSSIEQQQACLEQSISQTMNAQNLLQQQTKVEMEAAYAAFEDIRGRYQTLTQESLKTEKQIDSIDARISSPSGIPMNSPDSVFDYMKRSSLPVDSTAAFQKNSFASVHAPIRKPPKFDIERYVSYKEELELWRDSHSHVTEPMLIAEIALQSEVPLRTILLSFMKRTREQKNNRCFRELYILLDQEFLRDSNERALAKMHRFQQFKRLSSEDIFRFWIRFNKLVSDLDAGGMMLNDELIYLRALQALDLSSSERLSILGAMSHYEGKNMTSHLRTVTQKLLARPLKFEDIHVQYGDSDEQYFEEESSLVAQAKRINRPGYEAAAVKGAQRQMNFPNSNDKGGKKAFSKPYGAFTGCFQCGSKNHFSRDCNLPSTKFSSPFKAKAFSDKGAKPSSSLSSKGKNSKGLFLTNEAEEPTTVLAEEPWTMEEYDEANIDHSILATSESTTMPAELTKEEEAMMAQWWSEEATWLMSPDPITDQTICKELPEALIDSGATSSVAGVQWLSLWSSWKQCDWDKCIIPSMKKFRFGDGASYESLGSLVINARIQTIDSNWVPFVLRFDLVNCRIPLLISRRSLVSMSAIIDFSSSQIQINSAAIQAKVSSSGHLLLTLHPVHPAIVRSSQSNVIFAAEEEICAQQEDSEDMRLSESEILRVHNQLGHASFSALKKLFRLSKRTVSEQTILNALKSCTCRRIDENVQHPILTKYVPDFPGHTLFVDLCFPVNRDRAYPCLLMVDALTRFCSAKVMKTVSQDDTVAVLLENWFQWIGVPKKIVCDAGTNFQGRLWSNLSSIYGITLVYAPTHGQFQMGK